MNLEAFLMHKYAMSPAEARVCALMAQGMTYKQIAAHLGNSLATIKTHIARVYEKNNIKTRKELEDILKKNISNIVLPEKPTGPLPVGAFPLKFND